MRANYRYCLIVFLFLWSCIKPLPDEELTMKKTPYIGTEIQMDGYYSVFDKDYNQYSNLIFYSNGILLSFSYSKEYADFYRDKKIINLIRDTKERWNLYQISNDSIAIQGWTLNNNYQYVIKNIKAKIINDTTISLKSVKNESWISYHFKRFSPKPDSTNVFIK